MLKLRINPIVAKDLKNIRDYIAEDNEDYVIIYNKILFHNVY
jgi:toxin ParE1/3/4